MIVQNNVNFVIIRAQSHVGCNPKMHLDVTLDDVSLRHPRFREI